MRKNCVDKCARDGRGAIEICLSEKGALAKKGLGSTDIGESANRAFSSRNARMDHD